MAIQKLNLVTSFPTAKQAAAFFDGILHALDGNTEGFSYLPPQSPGDDYAVYSAHGPESSRVEVDDTHLVECVDVDELEDMTP